MGSAASAASCSFCFLIAMSVMLSRGESGGGRAFPLAVRQERTPASRRSMIGRVILLRGGQQLLAGVRVQRAGSVIGARASILKNGGGLIVRMVLALPEQIARQPQRRLRIARIGS